MLPNCFPIGLTQRVLKMIDCAYISMAKQTKINDKKDLYECSKCFMAFYHERLKCPFCNQKFESYNKEGYTMVGKLLKYRVLLKNSGVIIPKGYHVHHIDFDKTNDVLDNYYICTPEEHFNFHHKRTMPEQSNWRVFVVNKLYKEDKIHER